MNYLTEHSEVAELKEQDEEELLLNRIQITIHPEKLNTVVSEEVAISAQALIDPNPEVLGTLVGSSSDRHGVRKTHDDAEQGSAGSGRCISRRQSSSGSAL